MKDNEKKLLEQEEKELAKMAKEEEKWKQQRIKDGTIFTGYDKVTTKTKLKLLLKIWHETKDHDEKLVLDDLMRDVERTKLGLTLNYHHVDEKLEKSDTVFVEQKKLSMNPKEKDPNHLIIEGDNLHTLTALKNTKQEVDVIYIDPPYNTGNEFAYNDKIVSNEDQQKHSKWLSFMKQRLELSKEIMSDEGIMFLSIDDNEQPYLRVLMDEIFGEENFLNQLNWVSNKKGRQISTIPFAKTSEYVLVYSKSPNNVLSNVTIDRKEAEKLMPSLYQGSDKIKMKKDERGEYFCQNQLYNTNISNFNSTTRKNLFYPIYTDGKNISLERKPGYSEILPPKNQKGVQGVWRWGKSKVEKEFYDLEIIPDGDSFKLYTKLRSFTYKLKDIILSSRITTKTGSSEIEALNIEGFNYPKPTTLIKLLLKATSNKNAVVLDYFAGSGTTGQAVMELNQEDGGNRRFILCTNNERTGYDTIKHPEKGIAQAICRERIYRVINGIGTKGEKFPWIYSDDLKSLKNNNVTYLKTELVNKRRQQEEEKGTHLNSGLFYKSEQVNLYRKEFDTDSTEVATDFKKRKTIRKHSMDR